MKAIIILSTALLSVTASAAESVAVISQMQGQVMVNQGKQFVTAQADQALLAGDRVMLLQDSSAVLRFKDGCESRLGASVMVVVPETSVCAGGVMQSSNVGARSGQNMQTAASIQDPPKYGNTWLFVAGGVAVIGSLVSDDSVSP